MITLAIIVVVIGATLLFWGYNSEDPVPFKLGSMLIMFAVPIVLLSMSISQENNIPEGFQKIESYSYVTDAGNIETLDGPYFKKGNTYYTQEMGSAYWIPFGQCKYVEIDLPGNENNQYCTSCGNELNAKDVFCSGCGAKIDMEADDGQSD